MFWILYQKWIKKLKIRNSLNLLINKYIYTSFHEMDLVVKNSLYCIKKWNSEDFNLIKPRHICHIDKLIRYRLYLFISYDKNNKKNSQISNYIFSIMLLFFFSFLSYVYSFTLYKSIIFNFLLLIRNFPKNISRIILSIEYIIYSFINVLWGRCYC